MSSHMGTQGTATPTCVHNFRTRIPLQTHHTCTAAHLYTHTQVQPQVLAHMCTPIYTCIQACTASHMSTHMSVHTCSVCMPVSTCTPNPRTHTCKPVRTCTCAHPDTHAQAHNPHPCPQCIPAHSTEPHALPHRHLWLLLLGLDWGQVMGGRSRAGTPLTTAPTDHQKLEREARICRLLKHSNIGE